MAFQRFSQTNKEALDFLKPNIGLRSWNQFSKEERARIWKYLEKFFFDKEPKNYYDRNSSNHELRYVFSGSFDTQGLIQERIVYAVNTLNHTYKAKSYGTSFLQNENLTSACFDFHTIFSVQGDFVVNELMSFYVECIFNNSEGYSPEDVSAMFREFALKFNEVLSHFNFNYSLTEFGFVPFTDQKILKDIYTPVIEVLSNPKWAKVNENLRDAFADYRKGTPEDYSTCITKTVTAVQAYLQLIVYEKIGKGDFTDLLSEASRRQLIPSDIFSKKIFEDINSVFQSERQMKGDAHPKSEYADAKSARLVLNLAMIFFQHCLVP